LIFEAALRPVGSGTIFARQVQYKKLEWHGEMELQIPCQKVPRVEELVMEHNVPRVIRG